MVLVSLDRGSELLAVVRTTRRFGVNILASHTVLDARTVPADPLTYHSRAFGTHTPLPAW
jgi:flavin reductase (DIM6/NTAB) family NADH-FMN oxidoreductase RutF